MNIQRSFAETTGSGTLYLVATPIGNLEDITFRAVRTLKEVQWIAAEDTRQTRKLTAHFEISARLVSYHEHNKEASGAELIRLLQSGESVALVSDAGIPAISDPGYELVCQAIEAEIAVVPIPGANAALSALIISGLRTDRFLFVGFLPRDKKGLARELAALAGQTATLLIYESPHRLEKTLTAMREAWGERRVAVIRELTKKYEEALRGTLGECLDHVRTNGVQGEYVMAVEGYSEGFGPDIREAEWWEALSVRQHVAHYEEKGHTAKEAMRLAASDRGLAKREIYNQIHR